MSPWNSGLKIVLLALLVGSFAQSIALLSQATGLLFIGLEVLFWLAWLSGMIGTFIYFRELWRYTPRKNTRDE